MQEQSAPGRDLAHLVEGPLGLCIDGSLPASDVAYEADDKDLLAVLSVYQS